MLIKRCVCVCAGKRGPFKIKRKKKSVHPSDVGGRIKFSALLFTLISVIFRLCFFFPPPY